MKPFLLIVAVLFLSSCGGRGGTASAPAEGDTVQFRYARNIQMVRHADCTVVTLANPWKPGATLHTYLLVPHGQNVPAGMPKGTKIEVPLRNAVVYTTVHTALLQELGAVDRIGGICDLKYINVPEIVEGCRRGTVADLGDGMNPDIEKMMDLHPDALLLSPFENSGGYGRVEKLDIPIVEAADYMESSPLGRSEWMLFYGALFGCEACADSLFATIEKDYLQLKALARRAGERPVVLSDFMNGGTWYVPGGRSTTGQLYADANSRYVFADDSHSGSVPFPFETVLDRGSEAEIWLIRYNQRTNMTYDQMERDFSGYRGFKAFQQHRIYGCNTLYKPYYELANFHPNLILRDMIKIFHPSLLPGYQLRFFEKLE